MPIRLATIDYIIVVVAANVEKYQTVIADLVYRRASSSDFATFPVTKMIKSAGQSDLRRTVSALTRDSPA